METNNVVSIKEGLCRTWLPLIEAKVQNYYLCFIIDTGSTHCVLDESIADFLKDNINLVIHMDPISISDPETNDLRAKCMDIVSHIGAEMSSPISIHDFRIVKGVTHTNVLFDVNVSNELSLTNAELCERISQDVKKINSHYNLVLTIDRDYFSERYGK